MKYFFIGDEEAAIGFRMVGVETALVRTAEECLTALESAIKNKEVAIILIVDTTADLIREHVDEYVFTLDFPLICEIPGAGGRIPGRPTLHELATQAIGIKL